MDSRNDPIYLFYVDARFRSAHAQAHKFSIVWHHLLVQYLRWIHRGRVMVLQQRRSTDDINFWDLWIHSLMVLQHGRSTDGN
jgi:hypothetical protein